MTGVRHRVGGVNSLHAPVVDEQLETATDEPPVSLGIPGTGTWSDELAARIPDGARVTIATDADNAGDGYAAMLHSQLF